MSKAKDVNELGGVPVLLKSADVARILGVTGQCLRAWRMRGRGPKVIRSGSWVRYRKQDLEAWLESQAAEPVASGS